MFRRAARKPIWGRFAAASSLTPNVSEGISSEGISSEGISSEGIGAWSRTEPSIPHTPAPPNLNCAATYD